MGRQLLLRTISDLQEAFARVQRAVDQAQVEPDHPANGARPNNTLHSEEGGLPLGANEERVRAEVVPEAGNAGQEESAASAYAATTRADRARARQPESGGGRLQREAPIVSRCSFGTDRGWPSAPTEAARTKETARARKPRCRRCRNCRAQRVRRKVLRHAGTYLDVI
ncbi:hypothetical protein HPB52_007334 [Rhipicephalus sanguineus]|uniref:Uncharacterized protein n=1 Tax=Rhipicephalus sanguineus TaxID=34632 RepID=A0A9D4SXY1_RHISA|nr:hypothetical protein HPB52_007334 [Rhipicephalus sanguineus]